MTGLHLVSIAMDARAFDAFAISTGNDDDDRGYATHLALRQRFGTAGPQPFKLMAEDPSRLHVLGYTSESQALLDMAALPATNPLLDDVFATPPRIKSMPETWTIGSRYAFEVKVRPIVRYGNRTLERRRAEGKHPARERDAFLAAIQGLPETAGIVRGDVYTSWLTERFKDIAPVSKSEILTMRQVRTRRSPHGNGKHSSIEGYEAVFKGELTIENPEEFTTLLQRGVGRHATFGYGMLLLRPPRP